MTGIGSIFNIAKQALSAQQAALNVTGSNIANVNNENYSRQLVSFSSAQPVQVGGLLLGTGVEIEGIQSAADKLLEDRLAEEKSDLAAYREEEVYLNILEAIFSEDTETSLSVLMSDFWNGWLDLSNNPAGSAERATLYQSGLLISDQFNAVAGDLMQMETDLAREIEAAVTEVNTLTQAIAELNREIVAQEAGGITAGSLRDQRNALLTELSERIDIDTFEQENGSLTVTTAGGFTLVNWTEAVPLKMSGGRVVWEKSSGSADITDLIVQGSIAGWLEVRDEILPQCAAELDSLARELVWAVNLEHCQGAGLSYFSTQVTGTYATTETGLVSTLAYFDRVDTSKDFKIRIQDDSSDPPSCTEVVVDLSGAAPASSPTIDVSGAANSVLDTYTFTVSPPGGVVGGATAVEVEWSSGLLAGNFSIEAGEVPSVVEVDGMRIEFTAATGPFPQDTFTITADKDGNPAENVSSYTLTDLAGDINTAVIAAGGGVTASVMNNRLVLTPDSNDFSFAFGDDGGSGYEDSGLAAALGINTFYSGQDAMTIGVNSLLSDTDHIAAGRIEASTGECVAGDNSSALAIADLQFAALDIPRWVFERGSAASSSASSVTAEEYYETMISSLGIKMQSVSRQREFGQSIVDDLQGQRDAISAVSLDEEMINLAKFQAAYNAASKLLTVADEMLDTLLSIR